MKFFLFAAPALAILLTAAPVSDAVTKDTIAKWMTELSNWGRWGKDDQKGTLNLITPEKRKQALRLVKDGVSVSLAHNIDKLKTPDSPPARSGNDAR